MKFVIFGGTPGSGKTSVIKHVIEELKDLKIYYIKFDVLKTMDDVLIREKFGITTEKGISGDICPDHYSVMLFPNIIKKQKDKDLVIAETAGLCLRCAPYVNEGLGIAVLNIASGKPSSYGPLLTHADAVAITKGDMVSQAEREIFRIGVLKMNEKATIIETNGLTGEGALEVAEIIRNMPETKGKLTLRWPMPTALCGYCYGCKIVDPIEANKRYLLAKKIKEKIPNINCGKCGFKCCNDFIRAVLDGEAEESRCPYLRKKEFKLANRAKEP